MAKPKKPAKRQKKVALDEVSEKKTSKKGATKVASKEVDEIDDESMDDFDLDEIPTKSVRRRKKLSDPDEEDLMRLS